MSGLVPLRFLQAGECHWSSHTWLGHRCLRYLGPPAGRSRAPVCFVVLLGGLQLAAPTFLTVGRDRPHRHLTWARARAIITFEAAPNARSPGFRLGYFGGNREPRGRADQPGRGRSDFDDQVEKGMAEGTPEDTARSRLSSSGVDVVVFDIPTPRHVPIRTPSAAGRCRAANTLWCRSCGWGGGRSRWPQLRRRRS